MNALNYTARLIEDLGAMRVRAQGNLSRGVSPQVMRTDADLRRMIKKLSDTQKFVIPDGGQLVEWKSVVRAAQGKSLRMPFDRMTIEYAFDQDPGEIKEGRSVSKRRVALCLTGDAARAFARENDSAVFETGLFAGINRPAVVVAFYDAANLYADIEVAGRDRISWVPNMGAMALDLDHAILEDGQRIQMVPFMWLGAALDGASPARIDEIVQCSLDDSLDEVVAVLNVAAVCGCRNVKTQITPAPHALNKKRLASGKPPIDAFHTLCLNVVPPGALASPSRERTPSGASGRASPIFHVRRGHIRTLEGHDPIWVNQAAVNIERMGETEGAKQYRMRN